ncbi:host specificity factor TipJ family phage tail protein [Photobacterium leiognathi]|uniref:host specificity factor TipJ family phage tail protein n=1 Tax=Photobacterium leiognathi TaxID=553611 RepID=UPI000D179AC0|nr:host specificity factor TipJ family phage tail protein [Photobacterium leiognathi]PSW53061.1 hypothetical protein C0W50_19830 [Photobacterium leiognathi subsp. mandapamensis]
MSVLIVTYPSKLDHANAEHQSVAAGQTLTDVLTANVPSFKVMATPPISATLNGQPLLPVEWDSTELKAGDVVTLTVEPKGVELIIAAVVAVVAGVGAAMVMSNMAPDDNYQQTIPDGSPIYDVNAQGNRVRMMAPIPEVFGTHGTYPCLINPPHRYYYGDDEYLLLMTMVSRGYLALTNDDIQIGNTPISQYSGDIDTAIFDPQQSVNSHPAWLNVYTSPEVGSTAGTSGIELEGAVNSIVPEKVNFAGQRLKMFKATDTGAIVYWPPEWEEGTYLTIAGTQAPPTVKATGNRGCWGPYTDGRLHFRTQDPNAEKLKPHQYIQYRNYGHTGTGVVTWVGKNTIDGEQYTMVEFVDENGDPIMVSLSHNDKNDLVPMGFNDGQFKVKAITANDATVSRCYPNNSHLTNWPWNHEHTDDSKNVRITIQNALPGKVVGPYFACPINEVTNEIRVDVRYPEGIGYMKDDGSIEERELRIMLEWQETEGGSWKQQEFKRSGGTKDQLGNTITLSLSQYCRPKFRAYRITGKADDTRTWDKIELVRLKAVLESKSSYPDGTTLAVRIKGTNALSRSAENKLFCTPTRLLHVPSGNGWTGSDYNNKAGMQATNDIAPVLRYISHQIGLTDAQIGQDELHRLHHVWRGRGDTFAAQFDNKDTYWAAIKRLLAVGYAVPTLEFGQIVPVRDEPRTTYDHMYQPDNMTGKGLKTKTKLIDADEPDGIEVEFFSSETWKADTVVCLLPGDRGIKPRKIKAFGITDYQKAWQFGMRERRLARYIRDEYSWSTEMDGFNSKYMDFVAVADDVPGYSQNGRLLAAHPAGNQTVLELDQAVSFTDGQPHVVAVRKPDGRLNGPFSCRKGASDSQLVISGMLNFTPDFSGNMEPPLWMFGTTDNWCFPAKVTAIKPSGTDNVSMTARNYDERVYRDDSSIAPPRDNDPVLGMRLSGTISGERITADRDMTCFNTGDEVKLSLDGLHYQVRAVSGRNLYVRKLDGSNPNFPASNRPITVWLMKR